MRSAQPGSPRPSVRQEAHWRGGRHLKEAHGEGIRHGNRGLVLGQLAGDGIDGEDHDIFTVVVGDDQPVAGWIEIEIAREFSFGGNLLDGGELAGHRVDGKNRERVRAAIGSVKKITAGIYADLGGGAGAQVTFGQSGDALPLGEHAARGIPGKNRDRAGHLAQEVGEFSIGRKHHVPRAGSRRRLGEWRIVGRERAGERIEAIDVHLIETKIGHQNELVCWVRANRMRMRLRLAHGIGAVAGVGDVRGARADAAVRRDGERRDGRTGVVGDEQRVARGVEADVCRIRAAARHGVEQREMRGGWIDGIRANAAGRLAGQSVFRNRGVKMAAGGIENKISRRVGLHQKLRKAEKSRLRIESRDGKAAARHVHMRAEEDPGILRARDTARRARKQQCESQARREALGRLGYRSSHGRRHVSLLGTGGNVEEAVWNVKPQRGRRERGI